MLDEPEKVLQERKLPVSFMRMIFTLIFFRSSVETTVDPMSDLYILTPDSL